MSFRAIRARGTHPLSSAVFQAASQINADWTVSDQQIWKRSSEGSTTLQEEEEAEHPLLQLRLCNRLCCDGSALQSSCS